MILCLNTGSVAKLVAVGSEFQTLTTLSEKTLSKTLRFTYLLTYLLTMKLSKATSHAKF